MAWGARWGLKLIIWITDAALNRGLNGLGSPLGIVRLLTVESVTH